MLAELPPEVVDGIEGQPPGGSSAAPPHNTSLVPLSGDPADDDDTPIHDQLPSVEDVRTTIAAADDKSKTPSMTRLCLGWLAALCITGLIVGLSVGLTVGVKGESDSDNYDPIERFVDAKAFLSAFSDLSDLNSPQCKAAHWLAASDIRRLPIPKPGASDYDAKKFLQRYGLTVLYYALGGGGWKNGLQFLSDQDECDWYRFGLDSVSWQFYKIGASCEPDDTGSVKTIWVPTNNAQGTIPPEINLFSELEYFSLEDNNITSTIPDAIGELSKLWYLRFNRNNIDGTIPPSIGNLEKLQVLGLSNNDLSGTVPDAMSNMASLEHLALDDNFLEMFFTPILNLENLRYLYLEDNLFAGTIKAQMFNDLTKLMHLDVSDNFLEGTVPASIFSFPNLTVVDIHGNDLDVLPDVFPVQGNVEFLALHDNSFKGQMPDYFENLKGLTHLDLSINLFSGSISTTIGELTQLRYLFLGENNYDDDPVPAFLEHMTNLEELSLKAANVTGIIPTWLGELKDLRLLDLDGNDLEGQIPEELSSLVKLRALLLNRNKLEGNLPQSFTALTNLGLLLLDKNSLEGDINFMCDGINSLEYVISDCGGWNPEVTCTKTECCDICCDDADDACNDMLWRGNHDPIWENSYERTIYEFQLKVVGNR